MTRKEYAQSMLDQGKTKEQTIELVKQWDIDNKPTEVEKPQATATDAAPDSRRGQSWCRRRQVPALQAGAHGTTRHGADQGPVGGSDASRAVRGSGDAVAVDPVDRAPVQQLRHHLVFVLVPP